MSFHLNVLQFVSASQPFNALAYIFDGLHYGVSDFSYAASSMVSDRLLMFSVWAHNLAVVDWHDQKLTIICMIFR